MRHLARLLLPACILLLLAIAACGGSPPPNDPDPDPDPDPPPAGSAVQQVATGTSFSLALISDGALYAWGANSVGQLGDGTTTASSRPGLVSGTARYTEVAAGTDHVLALDTDGNVWAWGHNNRGQVGVGWPGPSLETQRYLEPTQVELEGIVAVAARGSASYALDDEGVVWAWGNNSDHELGDGTQVSRGVPEPVQIGDDVVIVELFAGFGHAHAIDSNGETWYWGDNGIMLGTGSVASAPSPVQAALGTSLDQLSLTNYASSTGHVLAVDSDGTLYGWGSARYGELSGPSDTFLVQAPTAVPDAPSNVTSIAAGGGVSLAVSGGEVYTWGTSFFGELGDGTTGGAERRQPSKLDGLSDVRQVAVGALTNEAFGRHALALTTAGEVYAWGYNAAGQLGTGDQTDRVTPQLVAFD